MDTVTISIGVAIIGCVIGVLGWAHSTAKDDSELAAAIARITTSLEYIENDLKEIKAQFRRMEGDVAQATEVANTALVTANAAHDRLDALGAESAAAYRRRGNDGGLD